MFRSNSSENEESMNSGADKKQIKKEIRDFVMLTFLGLCFRCMTIEGGSVTILCAKSGG